MAGTDHSLCLRAAGAEAADGFSAGESGQREGNAENQPGRRGDEGGPGGAGAGLPGDAQRGPAVCGRGRQADRAAGDSGDGETEGQILQTHRWVKTPNFLLMVTCFVGN